jgi:uncharacterized protein HemX
MNAFLPYPILADSSLGGGLELALKILGAVVGVIGVGVGVYVAILNRKWKKDKEHEEEKQKNLQLTIDQKIDNLRGEVRNDLANLSSLAGNFDLRLKQLEQALQGVADSGSMTSLKYLVETDVNELKGVLARFSEACARRHEKLAAHGSISDLKARVDEAVRKISSLEDFRHNSADRYVLMTNYQQDIKMVTDALGMLREDLRAVMDMVDNLA